ncbi:uncharacterized protein MELLADRAFT_101998 [Melampsora larici-populina 98AG31]|uniref:Uncharacterized protein n=1 Tax=Melampsora larici-populina (strain 98AG31 / pathotype 3-4-7) TaxID=747676 RepID=F4R5M8_MELLP|nr:uncharacterized protein MELLADRAFT_101998 [Melampsora larici-populina 98AG31]EGG12075.1 hypothetical protein MELLADRAFT_101998 [Melampsora larici-populina 98AG31]
MWRKLKEKSNKINYKSTRMLQAIKFAEEKKLAEEARAAEQAEGRKRRAESRTVQAGGSQPAIPGTLDTRDEPQLEGPSTLTTTGGGVTEIEGGGDPLGEEVEEKEDAQGLTHTDPGESLGDEDSDSDSDDSFLEQRKPALKERKSPKKKKGKGKGRKVSSESSSEGEVLEWKKERGYGSLIERDQAGGLDSLWEGERREEAEERIGSLSAGDR